MAKAKGADYYVPPRRRRRYLTNYRKRLALVKSGLPRLVVRKTNKQVIVQFVSFGEEGDKTVVSLPSIKLKKFGWLPHNNTPTAYLTGMGAAYLAAKKGVKEFVLDIGMAPATKGGVVFAALKGAVDAGLKTNFSDEILVAERLEGKAIADYAKLLKEKNEAEYKKRFAAYLKEGVAPEKLQELFQKVKAELKKM